MSLLLDTHVYFWWLVNAPDLPATHRAAIEDQTADVLVSAVSGWEIAIKVKLGKWPEAAVLLPDLSGKVLAAGFDLLPLTLAQAERAGSMELVHRDPFDRMLAAQALDLNIPLATVDSALSALGYQILK